jgi:hypothetical protein
MAERNDRPWPVQLTLRIAEEVAREGTADERGLVVSSDLVATAPTANVPLRSSPFCCAHLLFSAVSFSSRNVIENGPIRVSCSVICSIRDLDAPMRRNAAVARSEKLTSRTASPIL